MRYSTLPAGMHKAYRRVLDMRRTPWAPYLPFATPSYEYTQSQAWKNIKELENSENKTEFSFFPPTSVFWGVKDEDRLARYIYMFIRLLPVLATRQRLHRKDSRTCAPLTKKEWRSVLGGEYFHNRHWTKDDPEPFDIEKFWIRGDLAFFGEGLHQKIRETGEVQLGRLGCGCEPTLEEVKANSRLKAAFVYLANVHNHLHQLAYLVQPGLKDAEDIPPTTLRNGSSVMLPDFCFSESTLRDERSPLICQMLQVVLGQMDGVQESGRVTWDQRPLRADDSPPSPQEEAEQCRADTHALIDLFLLGKDEDDAKFFEEKKFRACNSALETISLVNLDDAAVEQLHADLLERWFVSCLRKGQWPCELHERPCRLADWCGECRDAHIQAEEDVVDPADAWLSGSESEEDEEDEEAEDEEEEDEEEREARRYRNMLWTECE